MTLLTTQSRHNSRKSRSVRLVQWLFEGFEENPSSVCIYKGGYLSLFVLQVCSQSELRKLVCVKIWNEMNLASMQIFRSVILITGYVTLKPRQLNFNDTFPLTYSSSSQFKLYCVSKPRVSNCLVNKSRLACVISIYLASALVVKGRLLLTNSMLKLGLKNPPFHLPKKFIKFNCSRNIAYSGEYSLV